MKMSKPDEAVGSIPGDYQMNVIKNDVGLSFQPIIEIEIKNNR